MSQVITGPTFVLIRVKFSNYEGKSCLSSLQSLYLLTQLCKRLRLGLVEASVMVWNFSLQSD